MTGTTYKKPSPWLGLARYLLDGHRDLSWQDQAACCQPGPDGSPPSPELFWPVGTAGPALRQTDQAKAICRSCPVQTLCLEWALDALPEGIAGGLTADERRTLKRGDLVAAS